MAMGILTTVLPPPPVTPRPLLFKMTFPLPPLAVIFISQSPAEAASVSLPRYKFWDIQVPRIHSPTRQVCLRRPGRPASVHF